MRKPAKRASTRTMKGAAKKTTRKAIKRPTRKATSRATTKASAPRKRFRREDIPGIEPSLKDMQNPVEFARLNGVPLSRLRARQVMDGASGHLVNEFYIA